jgi:hypothetical protein
MSANEHVRSPINALALKLFKNRALLSASADRRAHCALRPSTKLCFMLIKTKRILTSSYSMVNSYLDEIGNNL